MATVTVVTSANVDSLTRASIATTAVTSVGTVATLTTASGHNLFVGDTFTVSGVTPAAYNGTYTVVTVPSGTQVTYNFAGGVGSATVQGVVSSLWQNGDDLVINNNATVTVNTSQTKYWNTVAVNIGKLRLENSSTTTPIRFLMGRRPRLTNADRIITLANGLATWETDGGWIEIGTGSGAANQTMTLPTPDYHATLWVETAAGSGTYELWTNLATTGSAQLTAGYAAGLKGAYKGELGKFFVQELSNFATLRQSNSMADVFTSVVTFGDGVNGALVPTGAKVRVPNIVVTDVSDFSYISATTTNSIRNFARFVATGAGIIRTARTTYSIISMDATQAQEFAVTDCAFHVPPAVSKCYAVTIDGMGTGPGVAMLSAAAFSEPTTALTSITSSGTTCTATTPTNHGYVVGQFITIAGTTNSPNNYNGTYAITGVTATTFTYTNATTPSGTTATGAPTVSDALRVTSITSVGNTATVTTPYDHLLTVGDRVIVSGASAPYANNTTNGRIVLSTPTARTFTYQTDTVGSGTATGTIFLQRYAWQTITDTIGGVNRTWAQCVDAVINRAVFITSVQSGTGTSNLSANGAHISLDASDRAVFTNCTFINLFRQKAAIYALRVSNSAGCIVQGCSFIGATVSLTTSASTQVLNCRYAPWIGNYGCTAGLFATTIGGVARIPATGARLANGTRYYSRILDRRSWFNLDYDGEDSRGYLVGRTYSATPFVGAVDGPLWVSATPSAGNVVVRWCRKDPSPPTGATVYEVYRSTSWGTLGTVVSTSTAVASAAVSNTDQFVEVFNDVGVTNGTTYFYTVRVYQADYRLITAMTAAGSTITVTTATPHGLSPGQIIGTFNGAPAQYNRLNTPVVAVLNDTQFTFTAVSAPATTPSSGGSQYLVFNTGTFVDSAQQEATPTAVRSVTNLCLQSDTLATAPWTTSGASRSNAAGTTSHAPLFASNATDATSLTFNLYNVNSTVSQSIAVSATTAYTFSGFLRLLSGSVLGGAPVRTVRVSAADNGAATATSDVVLGFGDPVRFAVPITTGAGATSLTVTIGGNNTLTRVVSLLASAMQLVTGTAAGPLVGPTTTTSLASSEYTYDVTTTTGSSAVAFGFGAMVKDAPQQAVYRLGSAPSNAGGMRYFEIHLGTSAGFTPSLETLAWHGASAGSAAAAIINVDSGCVDTTVDGLTQISAAGVDNAVRVNTAARTVVKNAEFRYGGSLGRAVVNEAAATSNNITVIDSDFDDLTPYPRTYNASVATALLSSANNSGNITLQNVRSNTGYGVPLNVLWQASVLKGMFGGQLTMRQDSVYKRFGLTTAGGIAGISTGIAYSYAAQFDYIFNEHYDSATTGNLTLLMNASTKAAKPYQVLAGSPQFLNDGTILFGAAGDSMEWTWPHKIYGVSGFRSENLGPNMTDSCYVGYTPVIGAMGCPDHNDGEMRLSAIRLEYSLDTGAGFGPYKRLTTANLTAETVSASAGFNLKLRMTAMSTIPFQAPAAGTAGSTFVVGETINGATSGATAVVDEVVSIGTGGHLWVSSVTGTWGSQENIRSGATVRARTVATPNQILPINNQAVNNTRVGILRIFTNVDQTALYPADLVTLRLAGLVPGSDVVIYDADLPSSGNGANVLATFDAVGGTSVDYAYTYAPGVHIVVGVFKVGYVPFYIRGITLTNNDVELPVAQQVDRNYAP